jgi:hypothetical protein
MWLFGAWASIELSPVANVLITSRTSNPCLRQVRTDRSRQILFWIFDLELLDALFYNE